MHTISIQANDTLFFRDGRPFSMGEDSFAQGIFPPPPGVIYGALRTLALSNGLEEGSYLEDLIEASEGLSFHFIALQSESAPYFPLPLDLIVPKQKHEASRLQAQLLELTERPFYSNASIPKFLTSTNNNKTEDEPKLISLIALEKYLGGEADSLYVRKRSDFMCIEPKIGIGRDRNSRIAAEGKLFRIQTNRMSTDSDKGVKHFQILLSFAGIEIPKKGWLTLGGERKTAFYETIEFVKIPIPNIDSPLFKIYLATPAVFEHGWKPENLLKKYGLKLLAAAIDRPTYIGGWEMRPKDNPNSSKRMPQPKPMLQCVPAGSVYYVQAEHKAAAQVAAQFIHGKAISDNINKSDYCRQGFGIAYVGQISE